MSLPHQRGPDPDEPEPTFLPHKWGPDPREPESTACVWCHEPFTTAGGTACAIDARRRQEATAPTQALPELPEVGPPVAERLTHAGLVLAAVLALAALLVLAAAALAARACS